jgi:hypothetical protein
MIASDGPATAEQIGVDRRSRLNPWWWIGV